MDPVGIVDWLTFCYGHTNVETQLIGFFFVTMMQTKVFILKCYILIIADTHQE